MKKLLLLTLVLLSTVTIVYAADPLLDALDAYRSCMNDNKSQCNVLMQKTNNAIAYYKARRYHSIENMKKYCGAVYLRATIKFNEADVTTLNAECAFMGN